MGDIRQPSPVLLMIAAFAPTEASLAWGRRRAEAEFGPVWRESPTFYFNDFTHYYDREMGPVLPKRLWAFERLIDMGQLAEIKVKTNGWEEERARILAKTSEIAVKVPTAQAAGAVETGLNTDHAQADANTANVDITATPPDSAAPNVSRPLNLDPGYIDLGKLILASTKDHSHRIYLRDGIFAETTLYYSQKEWKKLPWTYPDYQSEGYQRFFTECRDYLHQRRRLGTSDPADPKKTLS